MTRPPAMGAPGPGEAAAPATTAPPLVLVSAALLRDRAGRVLLTQRRPGGHLGLTWEFPGGKLEPGESPEHALIRELGEELGIRATHITPWRFVSHRYDTFHLLMVVFQCHRWQGEPTALEVHDLRWVPLAELNHYPMPPADLPLVAALQESSPPMPA